MAGTWQFFIDRGGTFTDIVARAADVYVKRWKRYAAGLKRIG